MLAPKLLAKRRRRKVYMAEIVAVASSAAVALLTVFFVVSTRKMRADFRTQIERTQRILNLQKSIEEVKEEKHERRVRNLTPA